MPPASWLLPSQEKKKKITFHICRAGQDVFLLFSKSGRTIICIVLALFKKTLRAVALWAFRKDPCAITLCTFQKRPLVLKFLIFPKRPFLLLALPKNTNSAIIFDFFFKDPPYYRSVRFSERPFILSRYFRTSSNPAYALSLYPWFYSPSPLFLRGDLPHPSSSGTLARGQTKRVCVSV